MKDVKLRNSRIAFDMRQVSQAATRAEEKIESTN